MATLLAVVQEMLRSIAEVDDISSTSETLASRKMVDYLRNACTTVSTEYDWGWLYNVLSTSFAGGTWQQNQYRLPSLRKVHFVKYGNDDDGYVTIPPVPIEAYYTLPITSYEEDSNSIPTHYTVVDDNILFNPYPTATADQGKIIIGYISNFVFPLTDVSEFNMPDTFLNLVKYKAGNSAAVFHIHDVDEARVWLAMYQQDLNLLLSKERNIQFENASFFNNEKNRIYGYKATY